jgi:hypothetical protein
LDSRGKERRNKTKEARSHIREIIGRETKPF